MLFDFGLAFTDGIFHFDQFFLSFIQLVLCPLIASEALCEFLHRLAIGYLQFFQFALAIACGLLEFLFLSTQLFVLLRHTGMVFLDEGLFLSVLKQKGFGLEDILLVLVAKGDHFY